MADILIRMDIPRNCFECHLFTNCDACEGHECGCGLLGGIGYEEDISEDRRRDGCPIVELPAYGDLVDRDAFNMFICKSCGDRCNCESIETDCISCESAFRCDFVPILKCAPVIVPSNKEDAE